LHGVVIFAVKIGADVDVPDDAICWYCRHVQNLPPHHRGGLYNDLAVGHEDLLWSIRAEPELIKIFSELWGTDELLVSFGEPASRV
jgi:hypothetical protein